MGGPDANQARAAAPRRAVVVGLAATGIVAARHLARAGWSVAAGDDAPRPDDESAPERCGLERLGVELTERPDWPSLVADADLVVPSPGVRPSHPAIVTALERGVDVRSEVDLAAARCPVPFAAVTGTNGKSTVTTLCAAMLDAAGIRTRAVGNLGRPFLDAVDDVTSTAPEGDPVDALVVEVSSFQLAFTTTAFRPAVAVVLAIASDHLDWHGSFDAYVAAKARIVAAQRADDLCIFDAADPVATRIARDAPGVALGVGAPAGLRVESDRLVGPHGAYAAVGDLRRALPHDVTNALAAAGAAEHLGADRESIRSALADFEGLPHRVTLVGDAGGVKYYDDSKATNPHAALTSVKAFESVVLIAGGRNKGLDMSALSDAAGHLRAVVAIGESSAQIKAVFAGIRPVQEHASMADAVRAATALARPGDVVLLAPGCASFDWYGSYEERGDDFAACVNAVVVEPGARS